MIDSSITSASVVLHLRRAAHESNQALQLGPEKPDQTLKPRSAVSLRASSGDENDMLTTSTPLQQKALDLLSVRLAL